jgi:hypothetical protein
MCPETKFAVDSLLEEAVQSELVSWKWRLWRRGITACSEAIVDDSGSGKNVFRARIRPNLGFLPLASFSCYLDIKLLKTRAFLT